MTKLPIQWRRLATVFGIPLAAVLVLVPLLVGLFVDRSPPADEGSRLADLDTTASPWREGDRILIRGRDRDGREIDSEFLLGPRSPSLGDLRRAVAASFPGAGAKISGGRVVLRDPGAEGRLRLEAAPESRGRTDFEQAAGDLRAGHRAVRRTSRAVLLWTFVLALFATWTRGGPGLLAEAGLVERRRAPRDWLLGFLVGAGSLSAYIAVLAAAGHREFVEDGGARVLGALPGHLLGSAAIGFAEDVPFFGLLFFALGRRTWPLVFIYAATHFVQPAPGAEYHQATWALGFEALLRMAESVAEIPSRLVEILGLALVGRVLLELRTSSGAIWAAWGAHAGWYVARGLGRRLTDEAGGGAEWLFGTTRFYDGVLGWTALAATAFLAPRLIRRRERP